MRELHVVALSEDGRHVVLATSADAVRGGFRVLLDDRLLAAVRGDLPRPGERSAREVALPVKEIQARLRAGESPADIARSAGTPVARIERWAGPVQSEKEQVVLAAWRAVVVRGRRGPSSVPLGEAVERHLRELPSLRPDSVEWTAWRGDEPRWTVEVSWFSRGKTRRAQWHYETHSRLLTPADAGSAAMGHVEADGTTRAADSTGTAGAASRRDTPARATAGRGAAARAVPATAQPAGRTGATARRAAAGTVTAPAQDALLRPSATTSSRRPATSASRAAASRTPADRAAAARSAALRAAAERVAAARAADLPAPGASTSRPTVAATAQPRPVAPGATRDGEAATRTGATRTGATRTGATRTGATRTAAATPGTRASASRAGTPPAAGARTAAGSAAEARPAPSREASAPAVDPGPVGPPALRVVGDERPAPVRRRGRASVPSWEDVLLSTGSHDDGPPTG